MYLLCGVYSGEESNRSNDYLELVREEKARWHLCRHLKYRKEFRLTWVARRSESPLTRPPKPCVKVTTWWTPLAACPWPLASLALGFMHNVLCMKKGKKTTRAIDI